MSSTQGPQDGSPVEVARGAAADRRRRRGRVTLATTLTLVVAAALGGWAATRPARHVPVPPVSASAEQVVRAYLAASTAHDVATMNAVSAGDRFPPASRFRPTWMVSRVRTHPPLADPWIGEANHSWQQVVQVDVDLHVLKGHDLNFPDDTDAYWGYILARHTSRDPWRIVDQGVG